MEYSYNPIYAYIAKATRDGWPIPSFNSQKPELIKNILAFLLSEETDNFTYSLSEKYNLVEKETTRLCEIIGEVFLGDAALGNFKSLLAESVSHDAETLENILKDISMTLVAPIIDDLRKIQEERGPSSLVGNSANNLTRQFPSQSPINNNSQINQNNIVDLRDKKE